MTIRLKFRRRKEENSRYRRIDLFGNETGKLELIGQLRLMEKEFCLLRRVIMESTDAVEWEDGDEKV